MTKIQTGKTKFVLHPTYTFHKVRPKITWTEEYVTDGINKIYFVKKQHKELAKKVLLALQKLQAKGLVLRVQSSELAWNNYNEIVAIGKSKNKAQRLNNFIKKFQGITKIPIEWEDQHLWQWETAKVPAKVPVIP